MLVFDEERTSDSPLIERIWRCHSESAGSFMSIAECRSEIVITRLHGKTTLTVRGPETRATRVHCPADGEWLGIRFKPGTFLSDLPTVDLIDKAVTLPTASARSFRLRGWESQYPDYENADTFVHRLAREGMLVHEPVVPATLTGDLLDLTERSVQRRFINATGLTHSAMRQIERARYAALLLKWGKSILDTTHEAGYFDQPHLTRSVKHFIGQTPAELVRKDPSEQLSFLYGTAPFS